MSNLMETGMLKVLDFNFLIQMKIHLELFKKSFTMD
jgi:hypothetical protein